MAAGAEDVQDGVDDVPHVGFAGSSAGGGGDVGLDQGPLCVGDVAGVNGAFSYTILVLDYLMGQSLRYLAQVRVPLLIMRENHGRTVARSFVQNVADAVADGALAQEEDWEYAPPELEGPIGTITIGMDGTCLLMCEDGVRETMVGTIGFYDRDGERQHTVYLAAMPEYGKATFLDRLEREIGRVRAAYPQARYVGLADGAKGNWEFLGRHTAVQVIDFWHAAEYLSDAADALFAREPGAKRPWLESSCHRLKIRPGAARQLIRDLKRLAAEKGVAPDHPEVAAAIT